LFFTSARVDEAIIGAKTDPIYPKFAVKLPKLFREVGTGDELTNRV